MTEPAIFDEYRIVAAGINDIQYGADAPSKEAMLAHARDHLRMILARLEENGVRPILAPSVRCLLLGKKWRPIPRPLKWRK